MTATAIEDEGCDGCVCCRHEACFRGAGSDCPYSVDYGWLCPCTEE